jgi:peptide/nickel transport system substrate-binding protein
MTVPVLPCRRKHSAGRHAVRQAAVGLLFAVMCVAGGSCTGAPTTEARDVQLRIGVGGAKSSPQRLGVLARLLVAESVLTVGWDGKPVAGLAERWQWLDDGRALELQLRPGLKFHDGRPVTASVVADMLLKEVKELRTDNYVGGFQYVQTITSSGDAVLTIRLSRRDNFLLTALDETHIVDDSGADIGTGPFTVTKYEPHVIAEKYSDYYRGVPAIDRVEIIPFETQRSALAALMRGEVDMVQEVARESVEFLEGASRIETYTSLQPFYIPLVFNLDHPILGRVEVRRALSAAIDREQIVNAAMRGHGQVAADPVWPYHWAYSAAGRKQTFNPEESRVRFDAIGLPVRPASPGRMASRFRFSCLYWADDSEFERIALLLQRQLAAVGVDLALEPVSAGELQQRIQRGDFDAHLYRLLGGRSFGWTYRFWHSPEGNQAALQDTGYAGADAILERLRAATGDDDTRTAVAELQQRFYQDVPAAFLAWIETTRAVDGTFELGERTDPNIFANLWRWKPAVRQKAEK